MIYGIDVSSYQAEHYPREVGGHAVSFSFVKATESTSYVNPRMKGQAAWARSHGDALGFYHYLRPGDMKAQAAYFVDKCASVEGDILAADWEESGVSCAAKDTFIKEVKRLRPTHRVMLYCNADYWLNRDTTSYAGDGLWIAQYNGKPGNPSIKATWLIHQYTSTPVDTNISTFASKSAMKTWARGLMASSKTPETPNKETTTVSAINTNTQIPLGQWQVDTWGKTDSGVADGKMGAANLLGSVYGHSRWSHEHIAALETKIDELTELVKKLAK